ncbi:MAG: PIN domain-containing protein [Candidatus Micrarchaeota archaeon]
MKLMLDTFAWILILEEGAAGSKVVKMIEQNQGELYTTAGNLYEVHYRVAEKYGRAKLLEFETMIKTEAQIIPIDAELATLAAEMRLKHGLKAIDAFTYAAAQQLGAKVVTGDKDFAKLKDVMML